MFFTKICTNLALFISNPIMSDPSLPSDVSGLSESDEGSIMLPDAVMDVSLDNASEPVIAQDLPHRVDGACSDGEISLPDSVGSVDLPSDVDMDAETIPSPRVAVPVASQVPSPADIRRWLRSGQAMLSEPCAMELYSPPRALKPSSLASRWALTQILGYLCFDLLTGWDFDQIELKELSLQILHFCTVSFLYLIPPCTMFSALQRLWSQRRMPTAVWDRRWKQAVEWLRHCMEAIKIQISKGQRFMFEHPARASSWSLETIKEVQRLPGVLSVSFDMCSLGMKSPLNEPIKKRTVIMTNDAWLAKELGQHQCSRDHAHRHIQGSQLGPSVSRWCQVYPPALCALLPALCALLAAALDRQPHS